MRLGIARDTLAEAVGWVARWLPARPVVPLLSGILLEAGDGLAVSCFDYDVSARFEAPAEVSEPGTALVPGRLLAEITRSLAGDRAQVSSDADSVGLTCGSAEFTLVKLADEEYPALPDLPPPAGTVPGASLAAAVAQVASSASRDDTLPMLTGVFAEIDGATITLAATDRYRLAVTELPWQPSRPGIKATALVPARALAEAARTMAPADQVAVALRDAGAADAGGKDSSPGPGGMIGFEGAGRRLTARLLGGEFLKYSSRFPAEFGSVAEIAAGPLIEAVRRVSLVAERGSAVRLTFAAGEVVMEAGSRGQARAVERVPATFEGDERVIAFNPHYLLDGLAAAAIPAAAGRPAPADGDQGPAAHAGRPGPAGSVRIEFTSATRPAVITWVAREPGEDPPSAGAGDGAADGAAAGGAAAEGAAAGGAAAGDAAMPPRFRYLVVPLRLPGGV